MEGVLYGVRQMWKSKPYCTALYNYDPHSRHGKLADLLAATKQQEDEQPEIVEAEIDQSIRQLPSMNGAGEHCMLAWCKVAI